MSNRAMMWLWFSVAFINLMGFIGGVETCLNGRGSAVAVCLGGPNRVLELHDCERKRG